MALDVATDTAPVVDKPGVLEFANPSGKDWTRGDGKDKPPRVPRPATPAKETAAQRKRKVERRLGNLYMGVASFATMIGAEYPGAVLAANSTDFVDAVMEIAEDDPRILDWLDSKAAISGYWKLAFVSVSITLPIAAYYGMAPEFVVPLLGAPPIPAEPIEAKPEPGDEWEEV